MSLCSTTTVGLQRLIDVCAEYADHWKLHFGSHKSKCVITGKRKFIVEPKWYLNNEAIENVDKLDVLGVSLSGYNNCTAHIENRIGKCRRAFHSLKQYGLCYPGLNTVSKVALYKTACQPVLTYGLDTLDVNQSNLNLLEKLQGNIVKQFLGVGDRCHHSNLVRALEIKSVKEIIEKSTVSMFSRSFNVDSPLRDLNYHMLAFLFATAYLSQELLLTEFIGQDFHQLLLLIANYVRRMMRVLIVDWLTL